MRWFRNSESHKEVAGFCRAWESRFFLRRSRDGLALMLGVSPVLFLCDLTILAPAHYAEYMLPRLCLIAFWALLYAVISWVAANPDLPARAQRAFASLVTFSCLGSMRGCYVYYLFLPHPEYEPVMVMAQMMMALCGTLVIYRMWREAYALNALGVLVDLVLIQSLPHLRREMATLINVEMVAAVIGFIMRREFFGVMYQRYLSLCAFLPRDVAKAAAMTDDQTQVSQLFIPRTRVAVCLCADWRDFQTLASTRTPEFITLAFERFYDVVLGHLDALCPNGGYYMDWNADELFLVFYGEPEAEAETVDRALTFASDLCTGLFEEARSAVGFDVLYDVGMAKGLGLIGLMGPGSRKKTTVAAQAAGHSKRLEQEAKMQRRASREANPSPILVVDPGLKAQAEALGAFGAAAFREIVATSKDIDQTRCYAWQSPDSAASGPEAASRNMFFAS